MVKIEINNTQLIFQIFNKKIKNINLFIKTLFINIYDKFIIYNIQI